MKKKLLMFAMLLAGLTSAHAVGILGVANAVNLVPGYRGSIDLVLQNNAEAFTAWQAKITLPDGIAYADSYLAGDLNEATHTSNTLVTQSAGVVTITVISNPATVLKGTSGRLITLYFDVDAAATGQKTLSFHDVEFTKVGSVANPVADFTYDFSIADVITLDENAVSAPRPATGADVVVKRALKADVWNTLVLPFDMSAEQVKEAFGSDVALGGLKGVEYTKEYNEDEDEDVITGISITFESATDIVAHKPYIIKVSSAMTQFSVSSVDITEGTPTFNAGTTKNYKKMVGTYTTGTSIPDGGIFLTDNNFKYSTGKSKLKGFRAYFEFRDKLYNYETASARKVSFEFEETAGISDTEFMQSADHYVVFNLAGQQVAHPTKGIYIVNGKKTILK